MNNTTKINAINCSDKKIFLHISGGLGNQLFQYAFFLYCKQLNLKIDGLFQNFDKDLYGRSLKLNSLLKVPVSIIDVLPSETQEFYAEDFDYIVDYVFQSPHSSHLIRGNFLNIKYVSQIKIENLTIDVIPRDDGVTAIHMRRSEYAYYGILPLNYYLNALQLNSSPKFLIYTDEPNTAHLLFNRVNGYLGVAESSTHDPEIDFKSIMGHRKIIMANSSFSWMASHLAYKKHGAEITFPSQFLISGMHPGVWSDWRQVHTDLIRP